MNTVFASQSGCVRNTTVANSKSTTTAQSGASSSYPTTRQNTPGLGGQIGELTAALNTIGWNHHQVPPEERIPLQERIVPHEK